MSVSTFSSSFPSRYFDFDCAVLGGPELGVALSHREEKIEMHRIRVYFIIIVIVIIDRVSLCSSSCPGTHYVDQDGLEIRVPLASA